MHYNQIMTEAVSPTIQAAEQEVERPMIWNVVTIMWGHCNNNATKGGFGITNEIVWRSRLLLARTCCWTNSQAVCDVKYRNAHAASLL